MLFIKTLNRGWTHDISGYFWRWDIKPAGLHQLELFIKLSHVICAPASPLLPGRIIYLSVLRRVKADSRCNLTLGKLGSPSELKPIITLPICPLIDWSTPWKLPLGSRQTRKKFQFPKSFACWPHPFWLHSYLRVWSGLNNNFTYRFPI